jgi:MFS family permease
MGFLGSSFIAGCFVGSFILSRLADIIGRRPIFIVGLCLQISVVVASLFCKSIYLAYLLLFLGGIGEVGRYYVAYVYNVEMMPLSRQNDTGLYIFLVFGFAMTYIAIQFWFITKNWRVNAAVSLFLAITSLITTIAWLPESFRFLYGKKRFEQARLVLQKAARYNASEFDFTKAGFEAEM